MEQKFMQRAIELAKSLNEGGDIPIAAIIVKDGKIVAEKTNSREKENRTIAHAEILAIEEANKKLASWRLEGCDMYVTLEPCPMCAWAVINSRIKNLYFGSFDTKYGAMASAIKLQNLANSKINVTGGIMEQECNMVLEDYFKRMREYEKNS